MLTSLSIDAVHDLATALNLPVWEVSAAILMTRPAIQRLV